MIQFYSERALVKIIAELEVEDIKFWIKNYSSKTRNTRGAYVHFRPSVAALTNRSTRNGIAYAPLCTLRFATFLHKFAQAIPSGYLGALYTISLINKEVVNGNLLFEICDRSVQA